MSATTRSSNEIKDLISRNKSSSKDETVFIRNTLSRIEKNEIDVLNGRIEEQTNLAEFYKSRGDTYKKRISKLERSNRELVVEKEKLAKDYDFLNEETKLLNMRLDDLNETKVSLQKVIEEKLREIQEITEERSNLKSNIDNLTEDLRSSIFQHEKEVSGIFENFLLFLLSIVFTFLFLF